MFAEDLFGVNILYTPSLLAKERFTISNNNAIFKPERYRFACGVKKCVFLTLLQFL